MSQRELQVYPLFDPLDRMQREAHSTRLEIARPSRPMFDGSDYDPSKDDVRLKGQLLRIFHLMKDGKFRTLQEIADETHDPAASVSAQLRHLRKPRFGSHTVEKRARGERSNGLFEYRLLVRGRE